MILLQEVGYYEAANWGDRREYGRKERMNDQEIFETAEDILELTPEFELIAQQVDPAEMNELEWHVINRPSHNSKPEDECELPSCSSKATHYTEFLSGTQFFGCEQHVDELVSLRVASKKKKFEQ